MKAEGGRLESLLAAHYTVVNGQLAALYGVHGAGGRRLAQGDARFQAARGLADPGRLPRRPTAPSTAARRSGAAWRFASGSCAPTCRCLRPTVDQHIPGRSCPATPPAQRFDRHRADPSCASCHELMDKLGYGFESYDGSGASAPRSAARGGRLGRDSRHRRRRRLQGRARAGPQAGPEQGRCRSAWPGSGSATPSGGWRPRSISRVLDSLVKQFAGADLRVADLLMAIVESDAFRTYRARAIGRRDR